MARTRSKGAAGGDQEGLSVAQGRSPSPVENPDEVLAHREEAGLRQQVALLTAQVQEMAKMLADAKGAEREAHEAAARGNPEARTGDEDRVKAGAPRGEREGSSNVPAAENFVQGLTPWTRKIMDAQIPKKLVLPKLELYDGSTDPDDHLTHYQNCMALQNGTSDAVMCRAFISSLKGAALNWFHRLPVGSINSFAELADRFISRFVASRRMRQAPSHLLDVTQKEGETLRQYVARFSSEMTMVDECGEEFIISAMSRGLKMGRLAESLLKNPPASTSEMLEKAQKYINLEDFKAAGREGSGTVKENLKRGRSQEGAAASRGKQPIKPSSTLDFVKPIDRIFSEIRGRLELRPPAAIRAPLESRDKSRFCDYHREIGHNTGECRNLAWELERLAKDGKLPEYLPLSERVSKVARIGYHDDRHSEHDDHRHHQKDRSHDRSRDRSSDRHHTRHKEHRTDKGVRDSAGDKTEYNTIFVIHAPTENGGLSNSERKRKLHELFSLTTSASPTSKAASTMTFTSEDRYGVHYPHDDPLVISLTIGGFSVKRVLIDCGSSVNILYSQAFEKMGIAKKQLKSTTSLMSGFAGETCAPVGMIELPVQAGSGARLKTVLATFFVIDSNSPYNVILGRSWLHEMQAVASSFHQCVKFPIGDFTETIVGDQVAARQCLTAALKNK